MAKNNPVSDETQMAVMANDIAYIKKAIVELTVSIKETYAKQIDVEVLRQEFLAFKNGEYKIVRNVVLGFASLILVGFLTALIAFFIHR